MAAYLDDDFQSYAIGTNLPFGSFTGVGSIVAGGNIIPTTDRSFSTIVASYDRGALGYINTFSQYLAVFLSYTFAQQVFLFFNNGPNLSSQTFTLFELQVETDGTLTLTFYVRSG